MKTKVQIGDIFRGRPRLRNIIMIAISEVKVPKSYRVWRFGRWDGIFIFTEYELNLLFENFEKIERP